MTEFLVSPVRVTAHSGTDDLLSAGLGLDGLRRATPPHFTDPESPTPQELRRRAIWTNWRGIADLAPGGGYSDVYGAVPNVPGGEWQALARVPGASQPHRVLVQVPEQFDAEKRCVVVTASSGSRGIYGAIALAGAWGLPRGCAVAYTDKGAGTGYFDSDSDTGVTLDGTRASAGSGLEFDPPLAGLPHSVLFKHAHSGDNPEADWGRHVLQAAEFALAVLSQARPDLPAFHFSNTRVIAVGLSNGAGAVLRAAELDKEGRLAGVVAIAPNIYPGVPDARPLFDYATEAALYQPCALAHARFDTVALARPGGAVSPVALARCTALHECGLLVATTPTAQAAEAYERLRQSGWTDAALEAGALSVAFDLWRSIAVTYASAYGRFGVISPCGYSFAALTPQAVPRASLPAERLSWAADGSGIPSPPSIGLVDTQAQGNDPALPGLLCLRELWTGNSENAQRVKTGVAATRAQLPREGLPLILVHGADDGLVPAVFSGEAYVRWLEGEGRPVSYWAVSNSQHFDGFLGLPPLATRYVPLMPYAYRALDALWRHVAEGVALPRGATIQTRPRVARGPLAAPLQADDLGATP
ncbi:3-hydroxybutyrate oligomer hydrolase family protein [Tahibacter amnicola]|uniref:3-hydroxybutyrate oligomer hydrolase family protein n=1 Tax=Tahibacter amnicola TaxID=2976241 RepID=UPI003CCD5C36